MTKFLFKKRISSKATSKAKNPAMEISFVWNKTKDKGGEGGSREINQEVVTVITEKVLLASTMERDMERSRHIF